MATSVEEQSEILIQSFAALVRNLAVDSKEVGRLISLVPLVENAESSDIATDATLKSQPHTSVLADLTSLDRIVEQLERKMDALRENVAAQKSGADDLEELLGQADAQAEGLKYMMAHLPKHLPGDVKAVAKAQPVSATITVEPPPRIKRITSSAAATPSRTRTQAVVKTPARTQAATRTEGGLSEPLLDLVTAGELEKVPKTTKGRLQLEQINAAITEVRAAFLVKHALLSKNNKQLNDRQRKQKSEILMSMVPEHEGNSFLFEAELRQCPAVASKGEATARCLVNTLRHLRRVRAVRVEGTMTYVAVQ